MIFSPILQDNLQNEMEIGEARHENGKRKRNHTDSTALSSGSDAPEPTCPERHVSTLPSINVSAIYDKTSLDPWSDQKNYKNKIKRK